MRTSVELDSIGRLIRGEHENPFSILGPHEIVDGDRRALAVRAFLPHSSQVWVVDPAAGQSRPMRRIHPAGLYEAICPMSSNEPAKRYQLQIADAEGRRSMMHDPYAFPPYLSDYDIHLLCEGKHWHSYEKLGAHLRTIDGVSGVNFAVWAPNAMGISVVGNFNHWNPKLHPMRKLIPSGFWELFIPGMKAGELYKYHIRHSGGHVEKADPYGFAAELPPRTASIVADLSKFEWQDVEWMKSREQRNGLNAPQSFYEVHLGSWRKPGDNSTQWMGYRELAQQLVEYCHQQNYTHIELLPINEHPYTASWGYQPVGYYAPTSRYGEPEDFMWFVDYCHRHNLGVVLDWVPAHFPRDDHGLRQFDGSALYEHADPRQGEHRDWGTLIFNYGRYEVRNFLTSNALFWLDKYHLDGLRVDAVASMLYLDYSREPGDWVPNEFGGRENLHAVSLLKEFNEQVHLQHPGTLTIAEESTAWANVSRPTYLGGLGFDMKWNMGWMNDTLRYFRQDPIHRQYHHDNLTFSLIYAFTENFVLPLSHDEVVHGKGSLLDQMPGDLWQKFANLRLLYGYMWTHPGKKLLFMGSDFGQWNEWNFDTSLQWDLLQWDSHRGLQKYLADLNHLYRSEPSLHEVDFEWQGFEWIDCADYQGSTLSYLRKARNPDDYVVVCANFTPVPRPNYRIGVPRGGWYREISNSDSTFYAGSDVGNGQGLFASEQSMHGRPYSLELTLPPLGMVILKPQ